MKRVNVVLRDEVFEDLKGPVVGVDYGAWVCLKNKIPMLFACGDFDSVSQSQKEMIFKSQTKVYNLKPSKDYSDFEFALSKLDSFDEIIVYGGLGGRKDHEYNNLMLAVFDSRIIFKDKNHFIKKLPKGNYVLSKEDYHYFSFFPLEDAELTLDNFLYNLDNKKVNPRDRLLLSNEIVGTNANLKVHNGSVLMVASKLK